MSFSFLVMVFELYDWLSSLNLFWAILIPTYFMYLSSEFFIDLNSIDLIFYSRKLSSIPIWLTRIITCFPWKLIPKNPPLRNSISRPHNLLHVLKKFLAYTNKWKATRSHYNRLLRISNRYLWVLKCADDGHGEWKKMPIFACSNCFLTYSGTISKWLFYIHIVFKFFIFVFFISRIFWATSWLTCKYSFQYWRLFNLRSLMSLKLWNRGLNMFS